MVSLESQPMNQNLIDFFVLSSNSSHLKIFQWLNVEYKTFTNTQNLNKVINQ